MASIRLVEIRGFRSIKSLDWCPLEGINCLVGPGDSGKSTILDAIEVCLSPRKSLSFSDTDFHDLSITDPVRIRVTLGNLPEHLRDLDTYGELLRSFDEFTDQVEDEPRKGLETVLTVELLVQADLEPEWRLFSERTAAHEPRPLPWKDRVAMAPTRLGSHPSSHLSWNRSSVLNRLSEDRVDVSLELLSAARDARSGFGERAGVQLLNTLQTVTKTAQELGVGIGATAKALLDAHAVSFGDGAISLHNEAGIPLRRLGTGSARLLLAGLHRAAADSANFVLVDEVEFGLEPHRLTRLLHSLGSKEEQSPLQVFMTTHSPVAVRELSGRQLHIVRKAGDKHTVQLAGDSDEVQATLRTDPEAFLARTVIVCEGASEIGMIRGMELLFSKHPNGSLLAHGVAFVNANGGSPDKCLARAVAIAKLGYRVIAFIDNDKPATPAQVQKLTNLGGSLVSWAPGRAMEDVLFSAFPAQITDNLVARAIELVSVEVIDQDLREIGATQSLGEMQAGRNLIGDYSPLQRQWLGQASRLRKRGWFKSITKMEAIFETLLAPYWDQGTPEFQNVVKQIYQIARAPDA